MVLEDGYVVIEPIQRLVAEARRHGIPIVWICQQYRVMKHYYLQSALMLPDAEKTRQELRPFLAVRDMFRKVLISKTAARPWLDENGVLRLGIYDFLLDDKVLDMWPFET